MISMPIELYTDGSCSKNPGPGGLGYIIRYWEQKENSDLPEPKIIEGNQGFRLTTNNRMEIMAAIYGINNIIDLINNGTLSGTTQLNLTSDSEYLCNAINQRWINKWEENNWMTSGFQGRQPKPVKNKDLWEQIINLQNKLKSMNINFTITHIKGHSGHEFNERDDQLATSATAAGTNHIIDQIYENTTIVITRR